MIGKDDLEFYYGGLVLKTAKLLTSKEWDSLSYRSKKHWLGLANKAIRGILNDKDTKKQIEELLSLEELRSKLK